MIKIFTGMFIGIVISSLFCCTDAEMASFGSLGNSAEIKCYSGGKLIYEGYSTGRVSTTQNSDGWEFKDNKTGKFIRVSGDCVVTN